MKEFLKGKHCMVWSFMGNSRMFQALNAHGDRFDTVGIFTFEVDIMGTLTETGTNISGILPYVQKWPHIKWLLTIMNHGTAAIFMKPLMCECRTAPRNNTGASSETAWHGMKNSVCSPCPAMWKNCPHAARISPPITTFIAGRFRAGKSGNHAAQGALPATDQRAKAGISIF